MKKRLQKLGITFLSIIMLFLSVISPLSAGLNFGESFVIECYAISPITLPLDLLMYVLMGAGSTCGGNSFTDAYEEWKNSKSEGDEELEKQKNELLAAFLASIYSGGENTTALNEWMEKYCTTDDAGNCTISVDALDKDGKLIIPANVVKNSADLMDSLTANCTVQSIKGRKLGGVTDYVYMGVIDGSLDQLFDFVGDTFKELLVATVQDYENCAYLVNSDNVLILPQSSVVTVSSGGVLGSGVYEVSPFDSFFLNYQNQLYSESALSSITSTERSIYRYSRINREIYCEDVVGLNSYLYFSSSIANPYLNNGTIPFNLAASDCVLATQEVLVSGNSFLFDCYQLCPVVSAAVFNKTAETVEQDVTVDLSDENVTAISNAKSLEDVINAVDASSAELTSIRDGISDTNEKLDDTNAELSGIACILTSIYTVLQGDAEGTIFDFVRMIYLSLLNTIVALDVIVDNITLLADISASVTSISTFVISLPQKIADALADEFPALATDIASAIADTFPFDAQDIADAIADTFPFNAQDIAKAISDTFPAFVTDLTSALADTFPYVDIREVVNGLSIPSAKDIADAIAKILPEAVTIDGIIQAIVDAITLALTTVLLPDVAVLKKHFNTLNSEFNSIFEPIYLPLNAIKKVKDSISVRPEQFILKFPKIEYDGNVFFEGYSLNVTLEFGKYQTAYDLYILFTNVIFTLGMFNYIGKEFEKLLPF